RAAAAGARRRDGNPDGEACGGGQRRRRPCSGLSPVRRSRFGVLRSRIERSTTNIERRTTTMLDPLFLTTAIEAVVRAGEMQMARFGQPHQVDKKGVIDLVTEVDFAVERMFRDLIAARFSDHQVL